MVKISSWKQTFWASNLSAAVHRGTLGKSPKFSVALVSTEIKER